MTQPKSKSSKSKSKKTTATASTAKKVKRTATAVKVDLETVATPRPIFASAPVSATPAAVSAPVRLVTRAEFMDLVRKEAYRRYTARRSLKQGSPFQDWLNAEATVSGKLAAEGARLS